MGIKPKIEFKRIVQAVKTPTFLGFSVVSAALTLFLYWSSGTEGIERILLAITAFSLEGLKLYSLLAGNVFFDYVRMEAKKNESKLRTILRTDIISRSLYKKAVGLYLVYFLAAAISIFGSYNFTLSTIDKTVRLNQASLQATATPEEIKLQSEVDFYSKEIVRLEERVKVDTEDYKALGPDYQTLKDRIDRKITANTNLLTDYEIKKSEAEKNLAILKASSQISSAEIKKTSFQIMAENLSRPDRIITAQGILGVLLLLTSLLIELGIIVTSPHEDTFNVFEKVSTKKEVLEREAVKEKRAPKVSIASPEVSPSIPKAAKAASKVLVSIQEEAGAQDSFPSVEVFPPKAEEVKPARIEVHPISPIHQFLTDILPEGGQPGFIRKENMNKSLDPPALTKREIFNNLTRVKGPTNFPVLEFRKDAGKWYSNYSLKDIITILDKIA